MPSLKKPSLSYYLPIVEFITFLKVLELSEIQKGLSKIWTRVTVSIFYDINQYTTSVPIYMYIDFYTMRGIFHSFTQSLYHPFATHLSFPPPTLLLFLAKQFF